MSGSRKKGKNPPPPPPPPATTSEDGSESPPIQPVNPHLASPGKIMFTLQKQTEDVKSKKVTDNGQTPLLVHFDKKKGAAAMQVNRLIR